MCSAIWSRGTCSPVSGDTTMVPAPAAAALGSCAPAPPPYVTTAIASSCAPAAHFGPDDLLMSEWKDPSGNYMMGKHLELQNLDPPRALTYPPRPRHCAPQQPSLDKIYPFNVRMEGYM